MPNFFTAMVAGLFIVSVNMATAQDSGGLTPDQECLLNCSFAAVNASGCDIQNAACACASAVYASNLTQCTKSNCGLSASDIQHALTSSCANVTGSASGASVSSTSAISGPASSGSSKPAPNSSQSAGGHTGVAAVFAVGLTLYALLA
ncbi:hypothetical protein DFH08DRAFT_985382 [Mycena albidolilacea]|uniref:CFEM domain-containing protein n=1 Tax=Mycena albidolilacea TaxID=1033008 RepID=A0AAD7AC75_9AGAR|nr:hypothetical protein DFH08DRAFT_985382 [Mycena albidolilacea]